MLLVTFLFFFKNIYTQNLILNPSFESTTNYNCQGSFYDIVGGSPTFGAHLLDDWYQYNSPDYFNSICGAGGYSVPNSWFGYSPAKHGNGYVGISVYQGINSEYKEYFYQQLQSPLIAGDVYCLNFYVSRADRKEYAVKQIGAYFSSSLPILISYSYINAIPQVENQGGIITDTTQWTQIQGCFVANGGEQYVTIGNFHSNANTDTLNVGANNPIANDSPYSYYYIDDITLINQNTVGFSELNNGSSLSVYPNPAKDVINFEFSNTADKRKVELYDAIGELVLREDLSTQHSSLNTHHLHNGIYFYRILVGETILKTDKVVIIK